MTTTNMCSNFGGFWCFHLQPFSLLIDPACICTQQLSIVHANIECASVLQPQHHAIIPQENHTDVFPYPVTMLLLTSSLHMMLFSDPQ